MLFPSLENRSGIDIEYLYSSSFIAGNHDTAIASNLCAVGSVRKSIDTFDKLPRTNRKQIYPRSSGDSEQVRGLREHIKWEGRARNMSNGVIRCRRNELLRLKSTPVGLFRGKRRRAWWKLDRLQREDWSSHGGGYSISLLGSFVTKCCRKSNNFSSNRGNAE